MATTVQSLYTSVAKVFYEELGFTNGTGVITDGMFFQALFDTLNDFLSRTNCIKKIINMQVVAGVATYPEPDTATEIQVTSYNQNYIFRDSGMYLSNINPSWTLDTGTPSKWREDENPPKTLQLVPSPDSDGYQVVVNYPQAGYGAISSTSTVNDFDITAGLAQSGYGTINAAPEGAVYLETINQGYGTISTMTSSTGNIQMISAIAPFTENIDITKYVELVPDSFVPYIKYGICFRLFASDSEAKDNERAIYCQARYKEGLSLAGAVLDEISLEEGES